MATGDIVDPLETPVAGIVRDVRPGTSITIRAAGRGIRGVVALGGPTRGRISLASGPEGGLRPGALDVGMAGSILVVDARVDAETLTRARAMGVRGVIVAGLASKERRDFLASEARQRAALHRLPPYAVLVMDGATRRPMAGPIKALLTTLVGREAAIVSDPPMLIFDVPDLGGAHAGAGPRPDPRRGAERPRGPLGRRRRPSAVRRRAWTSRRDGSVSRTAASSPSRSATWSASSDGHGPAVRPLPSPGVRHVPRHAPVPLRGPGPDERARPRPRERSPGPATCSACGATSGPARPTSPRRSGPGSA